ncbi:hypothetical protein QW060_10005 [Myroides ceti]|uniref:Secreted protein n=1 Tax=Paenimyroides ceti TaxID=395087 RepID=A0ABT8CSI8_9FLAO|nr:hypothetical protein [Paenimyroides ceti]MDN3707463.1 hypothetical protein [Paenimyroides ceti]
MKNFSKHIILIFLISISSLLLPYTSSACVADDTSFKENHCSIQDNKRTESDRLDDNTTDNHSICKYNACVCSNFFQFPTISISLEIHIENPFDEITKKEKFHFIQLEYSSGFISPRFPPKIS